jgi:ferredoxin-thioredoxin reductase catalytic subunit
LGGDGNKQKILEASKKYAGIAGFRLQPDEKMLDAILSGLAANEKRYGYRFCPCRAVTGDMREDRKIICPCTYHRSEIANDGHCKCTLFLRK